MALPLIVLIPAIIGGGVVIGGAVGTAVVTLTMPSVSLAPSTLIAQAGGGLFSGFQEIGYWILHNILTPITLFIFLALFFVAQYYLIKFYAYLFRMAFEYVPKYFGIVKEKLKPQGNNDNEDVLTS